MVMEPAVKWTGSKRTQAKNIVDLFPDTIETYYECFCGGCSVLRYLMESGKQVKNYICSDINKDLINLWQEIKDNPNRLATSYERMWKELTSCQTVAEKRDYFTKIREEYNKIHNTDAFLFIMRTTTNGMPRYNKNGDFNNSYHLNRDGIQPVKLTRILNEWSLLLNMHNVEFRCCDYAEISSQEGDVLYLDPPYAGTKGIYFGALPNYTSMFDWLREQDGAYYLSFDGKSGDIDNTYCVPEDLYTEHIYLGSGVSSFKRISSENKTAQVYESLYIK